jgi:hypothetical protein
MRRDIYKKYSHSEYFPPPLLFQAVAANDIELVKSTIDFGAEVDCVIHSPRTGLLPLVTSERMFSLLVEQGIPINPETFVEYIVFGWMFNSFCPERIPNCHPDPNRIVWFISAGIDVNKCNSESITPLSAACGMMVAGWSDQIVKILVENGACADTRIRNRSDLPIHRATRHYAASTRHSLAKGLMADGTSLSIVRQLIRSGAAIDARDGMRVTPFLIAAKEGSIKAMTLLARYGADIQASDMQGNTARSLIDSQEHLTRRQRQDMLKKLEALKDCAQVLIPHKPKLRRKVDEIEKHSDATKPYRKDDEITVTAQTVNMRGNPEISDRKKCEISATAPAPRRMDRNQSQVRFKLDSDYVDALHVSADLAHQTIDSIFTGILDHYLFDLGAFLEAVKAHKAASPLRRHRPHRKTEILASIPNAHTVLLYELSTEMNTSIDYLMEVMVRSYVSTLWRFRL